MQSVEWLTAISGGQPNCVVWNYLKLSKTLNGVWNDAFLSKVNFVNI